MSAARLGAALAAVVAGPPLYGLVQSGGLVWSAALQKGVIVAVACAAGAAGIGRLAAGYERQSRRRDRLAAAEQAVTEAAAAVEAATAAARNRPAADQALRDAPA